MKILSSLILVTASLFSLQLQAGEQESKAWELIETGSLVIDVRTTEEYAQGHLADSLHIPYQQITSQLNNQGIRKDRQIVLYCRSGRRASVAEAALRQAGYSNIFNGGGLEPLLKEKLLLAN
ncbi:rhodanese-like domain-containing protein [Motiliproteus sp. MSK22-1]|uniref:rhodanese-like domain-containing protein n=1 Tax=Motiliproteus sp. MSK22-1 TaxID=1897630 RepID=UPI0009767C79|nr:rhodanese-like domain-containing protein [Motiliproteus sp. MSK22-1]OMH25707.1 hypothetical protein BGP75_24525 [Motiliproteus sp. MSK22-1]